MIKRLTMICMSGIRAPVVALSLTGAFERSSFNFPPLFIQNMPVTGKGMGSAVARACKRESSWLCFGQSMKLWGLGIQQPWYHTLLW